MDLLQLIHTAEIIEEYGDGYMIYEVVGGIGKTYSKKDYNYHNGVDNNNALSFFTTIENPSTSGCILYEFTDYLSSINTDFFQVYMLGGTDIRTVSNWPSQSINTTTTLSYAYNNTTKYSIGYCIQWGKNITIYIYNHSTQAITNVTAATTIIKPTTQREINKIGLSLGSFGAVPKMYRYYMWNKPISWNQFDLIRKSVA